MEETLEEAAENNYPGGDVWTEEQAVIRRLAFKNGAKWQQEQDKNKYSEEDMIEFAFNTYHYISELMGVEFNKISENKLHAMYNFEQFKKK